MFFLPRQPEPKPLQPGAVKPLGPPCRLADKTLLHPAFHRSVQRQCRLGKCVCSAPVTPVVWWGAILGLHSCWEPNHLTAHTRTHDSYLPDTHEHWHFISLEHVEFTFIHIIQVSYDSGFIKKRFWELSNIYRKNVEMLQEWSYI